MNVREILNKFVEIKDEEEFKSFFQSLNKEELESLKNFAEVLLVNCDNK